MVMQTIATRSNQALARIALVRRTMQAVKTATERSGFGSRTSMERVGRLVQEVDDRLDLIEADVQYAADGARTAVSLGTEQYRALAAHSKVLRDPIYSVDDLVNDIVLTYLKDCGIPPVPITPRSPE
jgi:hypothetical protein